MIFLGKAERQTERRTGAEQYRRFAGEAPARQRRGLIGLWLPDTTVSPDHLLAALKSAETDPASIRLKQDRRTVVLRASVLGLDVVIKKYKLPSLSDQMKYALRMSLARRFWAAARTLRALDIPTPEPLGFLECYTARVPVCGYVINRHIPNALTARHWIETRYARASQSHQNAYRAKLLHILLDLYRHGLYHRDTKCENILVESPDDPDAFRLLWIDLERLRPKPSPSRRDILRNLVQINGAVPPDAVDEADRLIFLREFARHYPWTDRPDACRCIQVWTRRRLEREKRPAS